MASAANSVAPTIKPGVAPLRAGEGILVPAAPSAFAFRHRAHRGVSARALHLELRSLQGPEAYGKQVAFLNSLPFVVGAGNCSSSGFRFCTTASMASGSGIAATPTSPTTRGRATGSTPRSAGPASSPRLTWCSTLIICASPGCTCRRIPWQSFAKVQGEFQNPWMIAFYAVGIIAASWHFAYGLWLFCREMGHHDR